jgi:hypothetical protein
MVICSSCPAQQTNALQADALLSLTEACGSRSDPKVAAGYYLDAADAALRSVDGQPGSGIGDSRLIYNRACEELAVLLQSNPGLWNRTETIQSKNRFIDCVSPVVHAWPASGARIISTFSEAHRALFARAIRSGSGPGGFYPWLNVDTADVGANHQSDPIGSRIARQVSILGIRLSDR